MVKQLLGCVLVLLLFVAVCPSFAGVPQVDQAWGYYYAADYANAIVKFKEALDSKKVSSKEVWAVHSGLAWSYYWKGETDKAKEEFNFVLKDASDNADALKGMGFCNFAKKDYDNAIKSLKKSLEKAPGDYYAQANLAWSFCYKKDYDNAKKEFGKTIDISAYYAESAEFLKILDERKDFNSLYLQAGWIYYVWKDYDGAFRIFNTAITKNKDDWEALMGIGYTYYQYKLYDKSISNLEASLKLNKESKKIKETIFVPGIYGEFLIESDATSTLAWCYYNKGNYDVAIELFKKTIAKHSDWVDAHDGLAWCYYVKKDLKSAEGEFNKALKLNKNYGSSLQGLAAVKSGK
ncbi:MAG: tetratricopeptide repeat protein [Candidatus Firestonebacteria bacterium]